MKENEISMGEMMTQIITSGQLSPEEERKIKEVIERKQRKVKDGMTGICLAEVIEAEIDKKLALEDVKMRNMCQSVYKQCFKESRVGRMDSFKLTESIINKFRKDIRELYGLNENEMIFFMGMLHLGLNKMSEDGILNFVPDKESYHHFVNAKNRITYIENPYSLEETDKIMKWADIHPADVRGLAVSLWFMGGISLTEIVNLTKKDCWGSMRADDSIMQFDKGLFSADRSRIARKALDLRPKDVKYIFVVPREDGTGWKKLTEKGLQVKLRHICHNVGITYKRFRQTEAIKINR